MTTFSRPTIYDAPGLIAGQAMGGVASSSSIKDTLFNPDRLTPSERVGLSERLGLVDPGGSRVLNALGEVATNPFVWLMFLTSPIGAKALQSGKPFSWVQKQYSVYQKKSMTWIDNFLPDLSWAKGSNAPEVALAVAEQRELLTKHVMEPVVQAEQKLLAQWDTMLGRKGNWHPETPTDPLQYAKGTAEREIVERWHKLFFAEKHNLDNAVNVPVAAGKTRFGLQKDGVVNEVVFDKALDSESVRQEALRTAKKLERDQVRDAKKFFFEEMDPADRRNYADVDEYVNSVVQRVVPIDGDYIHFEKAGDHMKDRPELFQRGSIAEALAPYGDAHREYVQAVRQAERTAFVHYVGDWNHFKETGGFQFDDAKLDRLVSSVQSSWAAQGTMGKVDSGAATVQGKELLMSLFGEAELHKLADSNLNFGDVKARFLEKMKKAAHLNEWASERWAPRNSFVRGKLSTGVAPPMTLGRDVDKMVELAPWAASEAYTDAISPLTQKDTWYDPEYLKELTDYLTPSEHFDEYVETLKSTIDYSWKSKNQSVMVMRPRGDWVRRHLDDLNMATVMETMPMPKATQSDANYLGYLDNSVRDVFTMVRGEKVKVSDPLPIKDATAAELLSRTYSGLQAPALQVRMRGVVASALSMAGPEFVAVRNAQVRNKEMAHWMAKTLGPTIQSMGGEAGRNFVSRLQEMGDLNSLAVPKDFSQGLANFFYTTHLGMNLGSIVMNLTQPLILAAAYGKPADVAGAFADSFKDLSAYVGKRAAAGVRWLTPREKQALMEESFPFMGQWTGGRNLLGIGPDTFKNVDTHLRRPGGLWGRTSEALMGGFEVSEWFNRNTTAHLMKRIQMRATGAKSVQELVALRPSFYQDVQGFVMKFQYGQHDINTPDIFKRGVLANPLARQFLSFPVRTAVTAFVDAPTMGGEDYWTGLYKSVVKGMGMSALVYEAGKHLVGADLSRGLYASAVTGIVGGDRLLEKNGEVVPLPPVASIPIDLLRGVASDDVNLLSGAVARLVPGGVALNRAWGMMPQTEGLGLEHLQKTYAGWGSPTPDGLVPVFKNDGTLVDYVDPTMLLARAAGLDMGAWQQQGALDNYLVKQRDQIAQYKRRYMEALYANDSSKALATAAEFKQRYKGVPLQVSQQAWKAFVNSKQQSRTERVFDRLQPEIRAQFDQTVSGAGGNLGVPLQGNMSAEQRPRFREEPLEVTVQRLVDKANSDVGPSGRPQAFQSFQSF